MASTAQRIANLPQRATLRLGRYATRGVTPGVRLPSGSPLELLSPRQRVIFLAWAGRGLMSQIAKLLKLSRETVYQDIRAAWG